MTNHKIHDSLPSGFHWANDLQVDQYTETGSVRGAGKVVFVATGEADEKGAPVVNLGVRLEPPRRWSHIVSPVARSYAGRHGFVVTNPDNDEALAWYVNQYNAGYRDARRGNTAKFATERTDAAYDDGFLDGRAGRGKWHMTYCTNHDACGED